MHIAIIGNGVAGITAARFIRKLSDYQITVISSETDHFYSRTALMYIFMGHMRYKETKPYEDHFWSKNRIDLKKAHVEKADFSKKILYCNNGETVPYDKLIIACGSKSNKFGWPGQDLKKVSGLYQIQDVENMEKYSENLNRAVIIGGGLIGIEMAEMFHSRHIPVSILVRENSYWNMVLPKEESEMINRHIVEHGIDLQLETELKEIVDNGNGEAHAVVTSKEEKIDCGYVGLTAGVSPNIGWLKETELEIKRGILVNEFLETNISDVFAIGDCAEQQNPKPGRRGVEAIWYTGRMQGETVAYNICHSKTEYNPGIWFNSAKFLDIEYQVYGDVQASPPDNHESLYWEHKDGKSSVRLIYDNSSSTILGFNLMGVRFRHEVCEQWIIEKANIEQVLKQLPLASFDPELYKKPHRDLLKMYNQKTGNNISLQKERSWNQVFSFLTSE